MLEKRKKKQGGIKVTSQCVFLLIATVALFYVHLLENLEVPGMNDSADILPSNGKDGIVSITKISQNYTKPPLEEYIQGWNITKNVNWLLDFSIVGAPKTGTSTLMLYLRNHTESIFIFKDERCEIGWNQHVPLLRDLYKEYRPNQQMGIKCPADMYVDLALNNYEIFFPETKFIVGLRNPILWLESFYNFRVQNEFEMKPLKRHIGKCRHHNRGVCTDRANFSKYLTQFEDSRQVFLYEMSQLQNTETIDTFLHDLQDFLSLKTPLKGPMMHVKPGRKAVSKEHQEELDSKKVNICDSQHAGIRDYLKKQASASADWILDEYLTKPNVKVSSPDYFRSKLQEWHSDPCERERKKATPV